MAACFTFISPLVAQQANLSRNLEPVIIRGEALAGLNTVSLNELFVFSYSSGDSTWRQIPFQVDEVGSNGNMSGFFVGDDGLWDGDDEFAFMAMDGGDRADSSWIADMSSRTFDRYEIEVANPLAQSEKTWVYIYRSSTLTTDPNLVDYVEWSPSQTGNPGEDTVRGRSYEIGHGGSGLPKDISITVEGGGNGQDLVDAFKFRASISALGLTLSITENQIDFIAAEDDSVRIIDGRIRVIRELEASLKIPLVDPIAFGTPPLFYYPYSYVFDVGIPDLSGLPIAASIKSGRVSVDLNENASGMKFVSANNPEPGFTVDGSPDTPALQVDDVLPDGNWIFIGGDQGTIIHLFPFSTSVAGTRLLYYKDDNSTDSGDTGDEMSYGDTGIDLLGGIDPPVLFSYRGYFLSGGQSSEIAAEIAGYEANRLTAAVRSQTFGAVTSVRRVDTGNIPENFSLFANYPNPFNPATEIRYQLSQSSEDATTLRVYNLLGQEIITLVNEIQNPGIHAVTWDGKDNLGRPVSSGVYIYRLQANGLTQSRKMLLVK